jgi:hypothetical protein
LGIVAGDKGVDGWMNTLNERRKELGKKRKGGKTM